MSKYRAKFDPLRRTWRIQKYITWCGIVPWYSWTTIDHAPDKFVMPLLSEDEAREIINALSNPKIILPNKK